jgi:hypothetical protein
MTRKQFRDRLSVLEEHRRQQQPATETFQIHFVERDGSFNPTICEGPNGFFLSRLPEESVDEFRLRADIEVLATKPKGPAGLVFRRKEVEAPLINDVTGPIK